MDYELAIIGAGPAGLAAGIYGERAGIKSVIFEKNIAGGQVAISPLIENYPGYEKISGTELADIMKKHAEQYVEIKEFEGVERITVTDKGFGIVTSKGSYHVGAVIIATGARHRSLNVPGEKEFIGRGVSYCATCDGYFFKGRKVGMVGGGNTAAVEALFLQNLGCRVSIIHRRDRLRAEEAYQKQIKDTGIEVIFDSAVGEIFGENAVRGVKLKNLRTGEESILVLDGLFVSIGLIPNTELAKDINVKLDRGGYIEVDRRQRTNIKGVYAAGDVTGGARQIVSSCAQGAQAALTSTEVLGKQYPF